MTQAADNPVRQIAPGVFTKTMPTGHTYTKSPDPVALPLREELACKPPPEAPV